MRATESVYRSELGASLDQLSPQHRRRLSMSSTSGFAQRCTGVMTEIRRSPLAGLGARLLGPSRRLGFPPAGTDVPFRLTNYAYLDRFGRETFSWARHFDIAGKTHLFNDVMIYSPRRKCIVNYLGSHSDIAADLHVTLRSDGAETGSGTEARIGSGIRLLGGAQRLYQGPIRVPIPQRLSAVAQVDESWDETNQRFSISVDISAPTGSLFGYQGWFTVEEFPCTQADIPIEIRPVYERSAE